MDRRRYLSHDWLETLHLAQALVIIYIISYGLNPGLRLIQNIAFMHACIVGDLEELGQIHYMIHSPIVR